MKQTAEYWDSETALNTKHLFNQESSNNPATRPKPGRARRSRAQYAADPAQTQRARPGPGPALGRLRHGRSARPGHGRVMVADPAAPRSACVVLTGAPLGTTLGLASLRAARRKRRRPRRKPRRQEGEEARRAKIEARRPKHRSRLERPLATRLSRHREPNHEPHVVGWSETFFRSRSCESAESPHEIFLYGTSLILLKLNLDA